MESERATRRGGRRARAPATAASPPATVTAPGTLGAIAAGARRSASVARRRDDDLGL